MDAPIRIALPADTRTLYISRADDATDTRPDVPAADEQRLNPGDVIRVIPPATGDIIIRVE